MADRKTNKKQTNTTSVKIMLAGASIAATIAGWAVLPTNDPSTSALAEPQQQQQVIQQPGGSLAAPTAVPNAGDDSLQAPPPVLPAPTAQAETGQSLPEVQVPQGSSNWPRPITRSRSSR